MGKKVKGQPNGKTTSYAFFVQRCRAEHKDKHPNDKVDFKAFSQKCSGKWKSMGPDQKKPFEKMYKDDVVRYEREMADWRKKCPEAAAAAGKSGKRKIDKDPNMPKRALSAFFFFCGEKRGAIREKNPDFGVGDIAKLLGQAWEKCTDKPKYEEMNRKDKERYEKAMVVYKAGLASPPKKARKAPVKEPSEDEDESEEEESDEDSD